MIVEPDHPVLAPAHAGRGRKPSIDFAVAGPGNVLDLAVEMKWVSASPTLLRDVIRDVVRLDMLVHAHARDAILMIAARLLEEDCHIRTAPESDHDCEVMYAGPDRLPTATC